jgi:hypothetical protein
MAFIPHFIKIGKLIKNWMKTYKHIYKQCYFSFLLEEKAALFKDRIKPVLKILLRGTPNVHEISVSSHLQVLGQVHCIQHLTPGTLGNATRKS